MTNKPASTTKPRPVRKMVRAGLTLNPSGVLKMVRSKDFRMGKGADVMLTAAVESVLGDVVKAAVALAREAGVKRVKAKHIGQALHNDPDLKSRFVAGIVPNGIHSAHRERVSWSDKKAVSDNHQSS